MSVARATMRILVLWALAAACGRADDAEVSSRLAALAATPLLGIEGSPLPACADVDLTGAGATTVEQVADDLLVVEVDGTAVCQGSEEEVSDALDHVVLDPEEGTPLPSLDKDGRPPPPPDGTPLPSAY